MNRRRKYHGPAISLFAFQDIITAVCGILIVMVLLLAIELTSHTSRTTSHSSPDFKALEASLEDINKRRKELQNRVDSQTESVSASVSRPVATIEAEIRQLRMKKILLEDRIKNAAVRAKLLDDDQAATRLAIETRSEDLERLEDLNREKDLLEDSLQEEQSDNRPIFRFVDGRSRNGWIAVIDSQSATLAPLGRGERPEKLLLGSNALRSLSEFLTRQGAEYVLVLFRPSGMDHDLLDALQTGKLRGGCGVGIDLISEQQTIFDPQTGLAQ
ncbi:hypothetical protein [Thalassoroseus pseudoceratinae]|uniref:hypothetical protein n=1 Tax=Thalassoroseus pseudoceratinae TaxID=2713176 RepID=UPI00141E05BE|nr:hypothetical protein [Thalassoroseus pseudoceratinae]